MSCGGGKSKPSPAASSSLKDQLQQYVAKQYERKVPQKYVVVHTDYPTTYGCHHGRTWSRLDLLRMSDVSTRGPFGSYDEAVAKARDMRDREHGNYFQDEPYGGDEEPPYDSAIQQNYDNDHEHRLEVMTVEEYEQRVESDRTFRGMAEAKVKFENRLKWGIQAARIRAAGRPHYSQSSLLKHSDIPCDVEVKDSEGDEALAALVASASSQMSSARSLFFHEEYRSPSPTATAAEEGGEKAEPGAASASASASASLFARVLGFVWGGGSSSALEELHYYVDAARFDESRFFASLAAAAPQLTPPLGSSLKLLRIGGSTDLSPEFLGELSKLQLGALERLDVSDCFSSGYCDHDAIGFGYGSDSDDDEYARWQRKRKKKRRKTATGGDADDDEKDEEEEEDDEGDEADEEDDEEDEIPFKEGGLHPYNRPLVECLRSMPRLRQLDLGYGQADITRYFWDYCVSPACVRYVEETFPDLRLTMADHAPIPHALEGGPGAETLHLIAVLEAMVADQTEEEGVRHHAKERLEELYGDLQERVRSARRSAGDDGGGGGDGAHNGGASGEAPAVEAAARGASSEEGSCAVQ